MAIEGEIVDTPRKPPGGKRVGAGQKKKEVYAASDQAYIDAKTADARLLKAKADREELKFLQESGEWIPRDEVRTQTATAYSAISQTMRSIPDNIERKYALPPESLDEISRIIDEALDGLADTMETMVEKEYPV